MDARLFDVLHHAADEHGFAIRNAIHVAFDRVVQEAVEQHRRVVRHLHGLAHVALEVARLVDDFHRAAAQHVRRTHHQRIADFVGELERFVFGARGAVRRLTQAEVLQQLLETLAVFGGVDHVRRRADDRHAVRFEIERELQRRLAAVLHDHADRLFLVDDFEHVFERQRFEVQTIGRVVVGRNGFRVAVDHDRFVAVFAHRERGVHAAVVELDALADPVRAAAQHHDLLVVGRVRFALFLVGRVHVRGFRRELGRARVDALVHRAHVQLDTALTHFRRLRAEQLRQTAIREAALLHDTSALPSTGLPAYGLPAPFPSG